MTRLSMALELECFVRILMASLCGCMIGYERTRRLKEAGVRTHCVVACGAALMMIVSKYGFSDIIQNGIYLYGSDGVDASRIASQVVTGVGFLGAGMISVHRDSVTGLTTAAGIWTTASIGMAIGCGMYFLGCFAAVLVVGVQVLLHLKAVRKHLPTVASLCLTLKEGPDGLDTVLQCLAQQRVEVIELELRAQPRDTTEANLLVRLPGGTAPVDIARRLNSLAAVSLLKI